MTKENNEIKSIFDSKSIKQKRQISANKIIEDLKNKDKLKIVADKNSTFFGVKSDKEDNYYTVNYQQKTCNCYDYAHFIEYDKEHQCKHLLAVSIAIKEKLKIAVKDLDKLKLAEYKPKE